LTFKCGGPGPPHKKEEKRKEGEKEERAVKGK